MNEGATLTQPVRGSLGNQPGYAALQALEIMQASGTLLLEHPANLGGATGSADTPKDHQARYWLGLWQGGAHRSFVLGEALELSTPGLDFTFYPHRATLSSDLAGTEVETETGALSRSESLPQFGGYLPQSSAPFLRALPALGARELHAHDTDLRALVTRLAWERFTGTLAVRQTGQAGVMLFFSGRIGAAFYEDARENTQGMNTSWGSHALRAALGLSDPFFAQPVQGDGERVWLELRALPPLVSASLLGLAQEQDEGEQRSGLEVSGAGYTYYNAGLPYLFVARAEGAPRDLAPGFYTPAYSTPSLSLPSEPPGWEEQRYYLTLRGRDALNPMTELAMRFEREFGRAGRQTLTQLARRSTVADVARSLSVEPSDLKPQVERLEAESLIRKTEL